MKFTAKQIAELLNGTIEENENVLVSDLSKIEEGKTGTTLIVMSHHNLFNRFYQLIKPQTDTKHFVVNLLFSNFEQNHLKWQA